MSSYFKINQRELLKIIKKLTMTQPFVGQEDVYKAIPKSWKDRGCGTGNLQHSLVSLYRQKKIATAQPDPAFLEGTDTANKMFFVTDKGEHELSPWVLRNWQIIIGLLVSGATIVTAIFSALEYYR